MKEIVVMLDNIRSNENVGSIFRTSDAAGVSKIYLVGITPAPLDRFNRVNKGLAKAALGAEKMVEWEKAESLKEVVGKLKDAKMERWKIIGIEQDKNSVDYHLISNSYNLAFVFGNEVDGLSKEDIELCDEIVEIPMKGKKESLNVAVAAGIILFNNLS